MLSATSKMWGYLVVGLVLAIGCATTPSHAIDAVHSHNLRSGIDMMQHSLDMGGMDDPPQADSADGAVLDTTPHPSNSWVSFSPTHHPTHVPTHSSSPTHHPTHHPSKNPTKHPTHHPTHHPTSHPTNKDDDGKDDDEGGETEEVTEIVACAGNGNKPHYDAVDNKEFPSCVTGLFKCWVATLDKSKGEHYFGTDKNAISNNWFIIAGTLLGNTRAGDYIPWDHDVDISYSYWLHDEFWMMMDSINTDPDPPKECENMKYEKKIYKESGGVGFRLVMKPSCVEGESHVVADFFPTSNTDPGSGPFKEYDESDMFYKTAGTHLTYQAGTYTKTKRVCYWPRHYIFPTTECTMKSDPDLVLKCPHEQRKVVRAIYGAQWEDPPYDRWDDDQDKWVKD